MERALTQTTKLPFSRENLVHDPTPVQATTGVRGNAPKAISRVAGGLGGGRLEKKPGAALPEKFSSTTKKLPVRRFGWLGCSTGRCANTRDFWPWLDRLGEICGHLRGEGKAVTRQLQLPPNEVADWAMPAGQCCGAGSRCKSRLSVNLIGARRDLQAFMLGGSPRLEPKSGVYPQLGAENDIGERALQHGQAGVCGRKEGQGRLGQDLTAVGSGRSYTLGAHAGS